MFDTFLEIFRADLFKDFTTKLTKHIDEVKDYQHKNVYFVLPEGFAKFYAQNRVIKELGGDVAW